MSLDYKKRLLELRRFAEQEFSPNSESISTEPKKPLVNKPKNKDDKPEYSPKEIQEAAFLEVIVSNLNIKDGVNDSV